MDSLQDTAVGNKPIHKGWWWQLVAIRQLTLSSGCKPEAHRQSENSRSWKLKKDEQKDSWDDSVSSCQYND